MVIVHFSFSQLSDWTSPKRAERHSRNPWQRRWSANTDPPGACFTLPYTTSSSHAKETRENNLSASLIVLTAVHFSQRGPWPWFTYYVFHKRFTKLEAAMLPHAVKLSYYLSTKRCGGIKEKWTDKKVKYLDVYNECTENNKIRIKSTATEPKEAYSS